MTFVAICPPPRIRLSDGSSGKAICFLLPNIRPLRRHGKGGKKRHWATFLLPQQVRERVRSPPEPGSPESSVVCVQCRLKVQIPPESIKKMSLPAGDVTDCPPPPPRPRTPRCPLTQPGRRLPPPEQQLQCGFQTLGRSCACSPDDGKPI